MRNNPQASEDDFDFTEWAALAITDPESFSRRRLALLQTTIANAPAKSQPRLEGLQFRIDAKRRLARTPMNACLLLSTMMWDSFFDLKETLTPFSAQPDSPLPPPSDSAHPAARIIPFRRTLAR